MTVLVGIDVGGTKTHLRVEGPEGRRDRVVPSGAWRRREWGEDAAALLAMATELAGGEAVAAVGVGAHGCDDGAECATFEAAFRAQTAVPVAVVNDAELMPLALGMEGEIGLVSGTGSIAVCRTRGEMLVAGGWGWIIGDDGSAAGLVRDAARAVAGHLDAGGDWEDPLVGMLFERLGIPAVPRIGSTLGALGGAAEVGAHASLVFEAAARGSALADTVIRAGGAGLARLVATLEARGADASRVVAGGSVIAGQPRLWEAFCEALACDLDGRVTPALFDGQPVEGACRLAATLARTKAA